MPARLQLEVAHEVPGRLRARCPELRNGAEAPADLAGDLHEMARGLPGLEEVSVRPVTGSVVFRYSLEDTDPGAFRTALAARTDLTDAPTAAPKAPVRRPLGEEAVHEIRRWWLRADRYVRRETGGWLDLRSSLPWLMLFLALRQIALNPKLPSLPWYNALYYGLQAVLRFPGEPELAPPDGGEA